MASEPRLKPLTADEVTEEQRELLQSVATSDGWAINIFATLVRHPGLFRRWLPFGGKLLAGKLPARDRELLILRTGWLCRAEYEWGQHVVIARGVGRHRRRDRAHRGRAPTGWTDPFDATLAACGRRAARRAAASATRRGPSSPARYDERQLIEVPMLVGHYHLVGFTLNSLGVQREPGVPGFDG